jgi:Zn-dependent metalloprotease
MALLAPTPALSAPDSAAAAWARADLKIVRNPSTGAVSFLSTSRGLDSGISAQALSADPEAAVGTILSRYQKFLRMFNARNELIVKNSSVDRLGMTHVRLKQVYRGIPVFGAEVRLHFFAGSSRIRALSSNFVPYLSIRKRPSIDSDAAIAVVREIQQTGELLEEPILQIYSGHIDRSVSGNHLAWMIRIFDYTEPSRNLYVVDAHSGEVVTSYNELPDARYREIYDANNTFTFPGTLVRSEGQGSTGDSDIDEAYDYLGDTYDYFFENFGRDSYDGAGSPLSATVRYGQDFDNAGWLGSPFNHMIFSEGFTADDVTGHEVTHGVTEYTANLIDRNESGALNEAISDIFGEFIDQINGSGNDSTSVKWLMGEDIPGMDAIRDMSDPPRFDQPDRVSVFVCTDLDNGGVHINSGIPNKAAYLMVEGGTFNGQAVTAIGREKTGLVHYKALSEYLVPSSGFLQYYNILYAACEDLANDPGGIITLADCQQVDNALLAVEMNMAPDCSGGGGWALIYPTLVDTPTDLEVMRQYRDEILSQSIRGRLYTRLLYQSSEDALEVLQDNPRLKRRAARLISKHKAAIEDVLAGGEGVLYNSNQIISFLGAYARKSPPGLKFFAKMVKIGMQKHKKRGKPFLGFRLE